MAERKFTAELDFTGHIEPSVAEGFEKFHKQLEKIQETAKETTETLKEMGEMVTDFGIALLGIEEIKNVFDTLNESGKDFLETQIKINDELQTLAGLQHKGPDAVGEMRERLEELNNELHKTSVFSREAMEHIESGLMAARSSGGGRLNVTAVESLVPAILAAYQHLHPGQAMTEADADAVSKQVADFILKGGKGSLSALGIDIDKPEVKAQLAKLAGGGKHPDLSPQVAAAFVRSLLPSEATTTGALAAGKESPLAQMELVQRNFAEAMTRMGTSMQLAFAPVARMINIITGDDLAGTDSPLNRMMDRLDENSKNFDNWVKTTFKPTWDGILGTTTAIAQKINEFFKPEMMTDLQLYKDTWGFIKGVWDGASTAIGAIQGFTKEKLPFLDIGNNLKGIGEDIQKSWTEISKIFKDLQPVIDAMGVGLGRMASVSFAGLEVAVGIIHAAFYSLYELLVLVRSTLDAITGHPTDISDVLKQTRAATAPTDPAARAVADRLLAAAQADREGMTHEHMQALKAQLHQEGIPGYAAGGIVTAPQVATVGEAGPEAIIPLTGSGIMEQLFGWLGVQKHAEDTREKLEKSTEDTEKMQEMFATLPELTAQIVAEFQGLAAMQMSLGAGGTNMGGVAGFGGPIRAEAYGPGSQGATAADMRQLKGAFENRLQVGDYAVSHDLAAGHRPGQRFSFTDAGGGIHYGTFADYSYIDPQHPNVRTIEAWNGRDLGHVSNLQWLAKGGIVGSLTKAMLGEAGPEAVIPLDRTPSSQQILAYAQRAMGMGSGEGHTIHYAPVINISGGGEAGIGVAQAMARAQEVFEQVLEDMLRRHRREQFA
jgi:SLT domain-containing protein